MGSYAQFRQLLVLTCLFALFGCTTQQPAPTPKPAPPVAPVHAPKLPPPPPAVTVAPSAPKPPPPPPPVLTLSDGPWIEASAEEATVAVIVTVRSNGLFRERTGVHYLRPAQKKIYRLVQIRNNAPIALARKEVPEACSATFHLSNNEADPADHNYSIHSTLKQIPVDSTRAITLNLRVNCRENGNTDCIEESVVLNGLNRTEFAKGPILAMVEIVPPERAVQRLSMAGESAASINNDINATSLGIGSSDWDLLHKKFQLTGQESRIAGWFQLSLDASIQFPDIRFACGLIEISDDHSIMKLRGPVRIEWDGQTMTSGDAVMRISPGTVQFESSNIQAN
ncbi:MAG: hypothetical protein QM715_06550 [Nibricoccus sp.]